MTGACCAGRRSAVHMDCLAWVNRDSYLPQGSRGLKVLLRSPPSPLHSSSLGLSAVHHCPSTDRVIT